MAHRRFFSREDQTQRRQAQFGRLSGQVEERGGRALEGGIRGAEEFDPTQAVEQFGRGFLDEAREGLGQDFESLVGGAVGQGRLRTGFFQRDAGRLFQDFNRRVSNAIAQQSLEASRQSLANIQGLQRTGTNLLQQQIDLLGGAFDRATAEENANRGGGFGGFLKGALGAGLGVVGGAALGPIGAAIGSKVAAAI